MWIGQRIDSFTLFGVGSFDSNWVYFPLGCVSWEHYKEGMYLDEEVIRGHVNNRMLVISRLEVGILPIELALFESYSVHIVITLSYRWILGRSWW